MTPDPALEPPVEGRRPSRPSRSSRALIGAGLAIATLAGAWIRVSPVADRPLWYDEVKTWIGVQSSVSEMLLWRHHHEHPPLSYMAVLAATRLRGSDDELTLRLPSLVAGILCIPTAFLLVRRIASPTAGLGAAWLVAVEPTLVDASQQARMYSLAALLVLISALGITWLCDGSPRSPRAAWLALGVVFAALCWTSHVGIVFLTAVPLGFAMWWRATTATGSQRSSALAGLALAYATVAVLCAHGYVRLLGNMSVGGSNRRMGSNSWSTAVFEVWDAMRELTRLADLSWLLAAAAVVALVAHACRSRSTPTAWILAWLAPLAVSWVLVFRFAVHPSVSKRYLLVLLIVMCLGIPLLGVRAAGRRRLAVAALMLAVVGWWGTASLLYLVRIVPSRYQIGAQIEGLHRLMVAGDQATFIPKRFATMSDYYGRHASLAGRDERPLSGPSPAPATATGKPVGDTAGSVHWVVLGRLREDDIDQAEKRIRDLAAERGVAFDPVSWRADVSARVGMIVRVGDDGVAWGSAPADEAVLRSGG